MENRIKPLKSVRNFRDFGGYMCRDGSRVFEGKLFRSGHFADITEMDSAYLQNLDIQFQVDLRRPEERERQPNKWPRSPVSVVTNDQGREEIPAHIAALQQEKVTPETIDTYMVNYYQRTPFAPNIIALYKAWFERLAVVDTPALVNCMAGKDRTGIICALTLHMLGVDEDVVMQDYMLTNQAVDIDKLLPMAAVFFNEKLGKNLEIDVYRPFMGVREGYLQTAFTSMKDRFGSLAGYIEEGLGISEELQNKIRTQFTLS